MMRGRYPVCLVAISLAAGAIAEGADDGRREASAPAIRPAIGLWYSTWWTKDDRYNHWNRCKRMPVRGRYGAGEPEVIADHYAQFRDLGIDFIIMDDTNGYRADGGRLIENIRAWFDFMDRRPPAEQIPICIGGGGEMRAGGAPAQKQAADYYYENWAQRPSYYHFEGKPLLLVDTDDNYGPGDFVDPRFTVRWVYNGDDSKFIGERKTWGWAGREPTPILEESMTIMPGQRYGYDLPKFMFDPRETPREGGQLYVRMWLRVLKANPRVVTVADWNNFVEETAIEDSYTWEDPRGYATANLYTRITRAYSRLRRGEFVKGEYYRDESKPEVYLYDGAKLVHQGVMPARAAVIVVPAGMLARHATSMGGLPEVR